MSKSMHIACMDCKEALWIGQSDSIYSGMPEVMEALKVFLVKHRTYSPRGTKTEYHELLYMPEPYNGDFEDIDWDCAEPDNVFQLKLVEEDK